MKKPSLSKRLTVISNAVERASDKADALDTAYLIRHLVFEAGLLIRSGRFNDEDQKIAIERAFERVTNSIKDLR